MATTSANMALIVWNSGSDSYNHTELAGNMNKIDAHDHTTGKGVQIPTGGIANAAITNAKLADDAITTAKIADGAITSALLDQTFIHPLGTVLMWWRPNSGVAVPTGWVVPTGQTLTSGQHSFGGGSITLPNLTNKFILGADTSGTGSGTGTPPDIGGTGGAHTKNLSHGHNVYGHQHTIPGHAHTVNSHFHTVADHDHGAGTLTTSKQAARGTRVKQDDGSIHRANTVGSPGDDGHDHVVSGRTGSVQPTTDSKSPATSLTWLTTDSAGSSTDNSLSSALDIRPGYVGLLFIMKVKTL